MFRFIYASAKFEDSASEFWTEDKELNPLKVDRLGYRSNADTILDFVRSGEMLTAKREGYLNNDIDDAIDYNEDMSLDLDNLLVVKNGVNSKVEELSEKNKVFTEFSTDGGKVKAKPNEGEATDFSTEVVNSVGNVLEDKVE